MNNTGIHTKSRLSSFLLITSLLIQMGFTTPVLANSQTRVQNAPFTTCADVTEIPQAECEALVQLYNSTDGPNWTNNTDWLQTNTPCNWYGVACTGANVYILALGGNHLNGSIPASIGNLTSLGYLPLGGNQLGGSIPPEIGNLTSLQFLDLSSNQLSGGIPDEIGYLTSLQILYLSNTQLSGEIPTSFTNLTNLTVLSLSCGLTSSNPAVISFIDNILGSGWDVPCTTGNISGHVYKADGMTVITDTLISVHAHGVSDGTSSMGTYVSQIDGSYIISGLAPGTYKVQANNNLEPGYVTKYYNDKFLWEEADTVEVLAEQTTTEVNFTLEVGASIAGQVYESDGITPLSDVEICRWDYDSGDNFACTSTVQDGTYTLFGLPSGDYRIRAYKSGWSWQFYSGTTQWDDATRISIADEEALSGIDFSM